MSVTKEKHRATSARNRVDLEGSQPVHFPLGVVRKSKRFRPEHPHKRRHVTVVVRPREGEERILADIERIAFQPPARRHVPDWREFDRRYAASHEDIRKVAAFYESEGLGVVETSRRRRAVTLAGTFEELAGAFGVKFSHYDGPMGRYHSHDNPVAIPRELAGMIEGVLGLSNRPLFARHGTTALASLKTTHPHEVAKIYQFPEHADGRGHALAVICLGGGFHPSDVEAYFALRGGKPPRVTVVELAGTKNDPVPKRELARFANALEHNSFLHGETKQLAQKTIWTIEATMDVELAGSFAPGARIVAYFSPNTERGRFLATSHALAETPRPPSVISCSWGAPESSIPPQVLRVMNRCYQIAALCGVTVCVSSGDSGKTEVNFPASSPYVLACGGTHLRIRNGRTVETVWNETFGGVPMSSSGGYSAFFGRPEWQRKPIARAKGKKNGRGVPDVSAKADLEGGYAILTGQRIIPMGGTSAAAPLWAGLVARLCQKMGKRVGFLNPFFYTRPFRLAVRAICKGDNGRYRAGPGWNPCTGVGTPKGTPLLELLKGKK